MAIAFYVPAEYGPPENEAQIPPVVDLHEHFVQQQVEQDANNNNFGNQGPAIEQGPDNLNPTTVRELVAQFVREVMTVLQPENNEPTIPRSVGVDQERNGIRQRRRQSRRNAPVNQASDNTTAPVPDLVISPYRCLPDVVTCHAGMSLRYGSSRPSQEELPVAAETRGHGPLPLSPRSSRAPVSMDFEVSLKLEMRLGQAPEQGMDESNLTLEQEYARAGQSLRHIGDNFQYQRNITSPSNSNSSDFYWRIGAELVLLFGIV